MDENGELLPILWSQSAPGIASLKLLPHREIVPGKLYVAVADVVMTRDGRIGMNHIALGGMEGATLDDLIEESFAWLVRGLRVEGMEEPGRAGEMAVMQRQGPFASSAIALPNFYSQMTSLLKGDRLLVGLPDPDTVVATLAGSGWADEVQKLVLESGNASGEFTPCVLAFEPGSVRLVAERSR